MASLILFSHHSKSVIIIHISLITSLENEQQIDLIVTELHNGGLGFTRLLNSRFLTLLDYISGSRSSHGMCYPVCGMVHIKEPLLLIGKRCVCGGCRFPLSLSKLFFTICPMPYNRK